jgi:hypothetical protein
MQHRPKLKAHDNGRRSTGDGALSTADDQPGMAPIIQALYPSNPQTIKKSFRALEETGHSALLLRTEQIGDWSCGSNYLLL